MLESLLSAWGNFYVIIGSSAAALTGLTFVVIALAADAHRITPRGLRAFVTPTIVHFGTVLALAAYVTMPRQSATSLFCGFGVVGLAGLLYSGITGAAMRPTGLGYVPVLEDWLWHVVSPVLVYGALLLMALLVSRRPEAALYGVGAASTLLLFIGIHNAWDVAASISLRKPETPVQGGTHPPNP